jgi:hypothetical protein
MAKHCTLLNLLLLPAVLGVALPGGTGAAKVAPDQAAAITVVMKDCKAGCPGKITGVTSALRLLFAGGPKDELVKRGTAEVDGHTYTQYLPKAKSYSTKNSKPNDSHFENTSTLISVDQ